MISENRFRIIGVVHHRDTSPGLVAEALAARGHRIEIVSPRQGDALPDPRECDAAVIFGGTMSVSCGEPWMDGELAWTGAMMAAHRPLLGICLGAQIIAKRLGAAVGPHPEGLWERGYVRIRPTADGAGMPDHVLQFHGEGFDLPPGATLLAAGDDFPVQAFAHGSACGLQFHPEATGAILEAWTLRHDLARGCPLARSRNRFEFARRQWLIGRWLSDFLGERLLGEPRAPARATRPGCGPMQGQRGATPATGEPAFA